MDYYESRYDYSGTKEFCFGLMSDIHIDSATFDEKRCFADLDYFAGRDASIFINGDLVDGIFPTDRKRYARSRDGFDNDAQINALVDYTVDKLAPWADFIDYIGFGNHEVSIVKYNNTDIIHLIAKGLNGKRSKTLEPIRRSGYVGFIDLIFSRGDGAVRRFTIYRDHGKGAGSPVTKGSISLNRLYSTYVADMYWLGHTHVSLIDSKSQWSIGVSSKGNIYQKNKIGIITPGYNRNFMEREYADSDYYELDFAEEKFYAPTGIGCGVLDISLEGDTIIPSVSMR